MTDLFSAYAQQVTAQEPGLARADHPDTSHEAAGAITSVSGKQRADVLREMARWGEPVTAQLLESLTGLTGNSIRPRLNELRDKHFVRTTGEYGTTMSGRRAHLWTTTLAGRKAIEHIDNHQKDA